MKLKAFKKFANTAEALADTAAIGEGKVGPQLKDFLEKELKKSETLAVADSKLGGNITKKLGIECVFDAGVQELMRGLRSQIEALLSGMCVVSWWLVGAGVRRACIGWAVDAVACVGSPGTLTLGECCLGRMEQAPRRLTTSR